MVYLSNLGKLFNLHSTYVLTYLNFFNVKQYKVPLLILTPIVFDLLRNFEGNIRFNDVKIRSPSVYSVLTHMIEFIDQHKKLLKFVWSSYF